MEMEKYTKSIVNSLNNGDGKYTKSIVNSLK